MPKQFLYIFGGAIGDALLGVHLGRTLSTAVPGTRLLIVSTRENRFVRELLEPLSFVSYTEMPKNRLTSWVRLLTFLRAPCAVAYWVPFQNPTSLWWRLIARCATLRKGSREVRCQIHDLATPNRVRVVRYDCRTDRMFDLIPRVLREWGIDAPKVVPHLNPELYLNSTALPPAPYICAHFFAPTTLRSLPTQKAQEVLSAMHHAFPSHHLVLTCAKNELSRAHASTEHLDVDIRSDLSPAALISLFAGASAYVGVDTGITHIACHIGIPCVVLGNRSNPCWMPYYAPQATIVFESRRCGCNGDKTGVCREETPEGPVYRCLFDIESKTIIETLRSCVAD